MIIDFNKLEEVENKNFKGGEKSVFIKTYKDNLNKIMHIVLEPSASIGLHSHIKNSEILYIIKGSGKFIIDEKEEEIVSGQAHYCPRNHIHTLINDGTENLECFAVVPEQ